MIRDLLLALLSVMILTTGLFSFRALAAGDERTRAAAAFSGGSVASTRIGRDIYLQTCAACHVNGVADAPKVSVRADWDARISTGRRSLLGSVLKGKNGMPPKGGNASITDDQAAAALDYMINQVLQNDDMDSVVPTVSVGRVLPR